MTFHQAPERLPYRRRVGGDVYLTLDPQSPDAAQVDSGFVLKGWKSRPPQLQNRPAFPGTAVLVDEKWLEVVSMEQATAGARVIYRLEPWNEAHPIRAPKELSQAACEEITAAHFQALRDAKRSKLAGLMIVGVGLLPGDEQERLALTYGINPAIGSFISAAFLGSLSIASLLLAFAAAQGFPLGSLKGYAEFCLLASPVLLYLIVESLLRVHGAMNGSPLGSLLVAGPYVLIRESFRHGTHKVAPKLPPAARAIQGFENQWLQAEDRVSSLPPTPEGKHRLEVRSRLPKEHWRANIHGIDWDGRRYILEDRKDQVDSKLPYGFMLEEADEDVLFRDIHAYDPTEVREVYRAQKRLSIGSWIKSFGMLWGFTDPQLQDHLAEIYGYEPWRNTRASILFTVIATFLMLGTAAFRFQAGSAVPGDAIIVIFFFVLGWDATVRHSRLRDGELTESVLGRALAPFVRHTLRWRAAPHWRYPDAG